MPSVASYIPLISGLSGYRAAWLKSDVSAGLAIAAVGLPSAIAYPALAGLPAETGLYASIAPLVAYALFGPSRKLIVGPDAGTMTVLAAVLTTLFADPGLTASRTTVAALLAMIVGGLCLAARLARLGILATFLSRPILTGFFAGISLSILVSQIGRVTGLKIGSDGLIGPIFELLGKLDAIHLPSLALAVSAFALLQAARIFRSPIPGPIIVVVLATALSAMFDFEALGIAVVGDIPGSMPPLAIPSLAGISLQPLLLGAAAIFLVSFGSGIIAARSFSAQTGERVDPNRELSGFGAANIAAGLFGAFPVTASDSRTAVNLLVGGKSQIAGLVAAAGLLATIVFLGDSLRILPIPALGAILAATALSLIDIDALKQTWRISRMEFAFALIAMWGPIGLGVLNGVVIAIAATLVYLLQKSMFPRYAILGRIPGRDGFFKLHRAPDALAVEGLTVCMIQGSLLFFNTDYIAEKLRALVDDLPEDTRWFVIDASAIPQIDSSAAIMLQEVRAYMADRGIALGLAELHTDALEMLERSGLVEEIGRPMIFESIEDCYHAFSRDRPLSR
ncbi:high affinity sulfate transporter 1 [Ensifer adhaerens]|uniref:High affinity sulfate transporter 1 n=1 Tax=Ensifer adhaerens TaxID=106592 RepID=A0ACC5SRI6_ENSAD|nr:SulP family inorganic anion transporter [Ensifer adhaerens]MBP1871324.1 high affinity sulfate transporter 1 [Ensifer adhaerens]